LAALDPNLVIPSRRFECLVVPEAAIPFSGSRKERAHGRKWVEIGHEERSRNSE
jgi:hypothetical protein